MRSKIRKSKKKRVQKQRQKQIIKINLPITMTGGGSGGGGIPLYIPGKPTVGESHLPNQAALVPNIGQSAPIVREDLAAPIVQPDHEGFQSPPRVRASRHARAAEMRAPPSIQSSASDGMPPAMESPAVGERALPVGVTTPTSGPPLISGGASAGSSKSLFGKARVHPSGREPTYFEGGSVAHRTRRAEQTSG